METLISDFSVGLFFWQTILFIVLLLLLRKYAWKPILTAVNDRERSIESALNEAKKAREEMALLTSENERVLKEAKIERDAILKEAREMRDTMVLNAKEEAKKEADYLVENARLAIQNEKAGAITELKNQIAILSIEVAEKVLKKELSDQTAQEALAMDMINQAKLN